jgi:hypothetical protein
MSRQLLNYIVDIASAAVMLGLIATGLIVKFVLPAGSGSGSALWTLGRHDWGDLHFWIAVSGFVLILLHVALHWAWVCTVTRRLFGFRSGDILDRSNFAENFWGIVGLSAVIAACVGFVYLAKASVGPGDRGDRRSNELGRGNESHERGDRGQEIRGSLTLGETAKVLGKTREELILALKLPSETSPEEKLGQLRQKYGFAMEDVRKLSNEQSKESTAHEP